VKIVKKMKTKDLIRKLQEADPSGELNVRINGGPISFVEEKEGYWDGTYNYLEKDKTGKPIWVQSTKNHKVDIYTMELFDFVEKYDGNLDEVLKHIRIEYDYVDGGQHEREFMRKVRLTCDEYNEIKAKVDKQGFCIRNRT